ncbi:hypothetical protein [Cupriavidus sp. TMH.W2]|uniref:hypothetical protein n=1 Tax=Cupriavidus sp. TMH.W2 TaxID=3434465 RepID=UPI003D777F6D
MPYPIVSKEELPAYIHTSMEGLRTHVQHGNGSVHVMAALLTSYQSASTLAKKRIALGETSGRAQLQIVWINPPQSFLTEEVLWECIEIHGITHAEYEDLIDLLPEEQVFDEVAEYEHWISPPAPPDASPLYKYHPQRLLRLTPWGRDVAAVGRKQGRPLLTMDLYDSAARAMALAHNAFLAERPLRGRTSGNKHYRSLSRYHDVLAGFALYVAAGRQIFDIPPQLSAMFRQSDVDDIAVDEIKLPYPSIYLHFGVQDDLDLGDGWKAEGAYITETRIEGVRKALMINVVAAPPSFDEYVAFDRNIEPCYTQSISEERSKMPLAIAVEAVLAEKIEELKRERDTIETQEVLRERAKPMGIAKDTVLVSVTQRNAKEELERLQPKHDAYLVMLRLIVNALCYITAYPKDIEEVWPSSIPSYRLSELKRAKNNQDRKRARSKLEAAGFSAVHLCGSALAMQIEKQQQIGVAKGTVSTHWVRGHWKRQAYGEGFSLRKIIWRMPYLVKAHESDTKGDPPGHIYLAT